MKFECKNGRIFASRKAFRFLTALLFAVLLSSGVAFAEPDKSGEDDAVLVSDLGGEFTLTNHNGGRTSLKDFRGKVVMIQFGYTYCPDICPMGLVSINKVLELIGDLAEQVQVLFISIDPERDTPERMKIFINHFNPKFIGLTGKPEEITEVARLHGVAYVKQPIGDKGDYAMAHSAFTYIIGKKGTMEEVIPFNALPEEIAKAVKAFVLPEEDESKP